MKRLWGFFSSISLTVALAAIISVVTAYGSIVTVKNQNLFSALDQTVLVNGLVLAAKSRPGLVAWVFALIFFVFLFAINTFVCTVDRIYSIVRLKRPVSALFPHIVHIGFIIALLGHLAGSVWGFKSSGNVVFEGEKTPVPNREGLYVALDSLEVKTTPEGRLESLKTGVTLFEGEKEVKKSVIMINSPVIYKGIAFYHVDQGKSPNGLVLDVDGTELNVRFFAKALLDKGEELGLAGIYPDFSLDSVGNPISLSNEFRNPHIEVTLGNGKRTFLDVRAPGSSVKLGERTVTLKDYMMGDYVVLNINKDPGIWLVITGSAILVIGMVLLLFFRGQRAELVMAAREDAA